MQSLNKETIYPNKDVASTTDATFSLNSRFVYFVCLVSAMGGLLFGYDWVVIGGAKPFYELYFNIADSPSSQGLAMSIALVGCMIGACTCGWLADKIGRKKLLIVSALVFLLSSLLTGAFSSFDLFLVARFFGGVGIGIASEDDIGATPLLEHSDEKTKHQHFAKWT